MAMSAAGQWTPCDGTAGLNLQAAYEIPGVVLLGGATGVYRSDDGGASFVPSNSGNDPVGPTRGFTDEGVHLYDCTSQGVHRSSDGGVTWTPRSQGLTTLLGHNILAVDGKLFLVGPAGVFRSLDQAEHWSPAGLAGLDVRCIAAIGSTLFVGTNGWGIFKSEDWGGRWVPANNGLTASTFRAIEAKDGTLFAGGPIGTGVFRSTDLGASWALLAGGLPPSTVRGFASDERLIVAAAFGQGVFCSFDDGGHWRALDRGLGDLAVFDLAIHEGAIYAATNTQGCFRFPIALLSDLNDDGCVDAADLTSILQSWGDCGQCAADLNGDGLVDAVDLGQVLSDWGACGR